MKLNAEQSEQVIDDVIRQLDLSYEMNTDVSMIREILTEIKLDDFQTSYLPMTLFFKEISSQAQALGPMISNIKWGLVHNGPAIIEFLNIALTKKWLTKSDYITKSVHIAFILEAITAAMCNSTVFYDEYVEHVHLKEKEIGIDREHKFKTFLKTFPGSLNFFGSAKAISLDMALVYFRVSRELSGAKVTKKAINELYDLEKISFLEYKLLLPLCKKGHCMCHDWLRINIYEAGATEYKKGFSKNALAAHVLAEDVLKRCHPEQYLLRQVYPENAKGDFYASLVGDNFVPVINLSEEWKNLYLTWNMAFILGELNNLHYLFPKLLIPSVLCAKNDNFLGVRIISLWVSINNALFLNFNHTEKLTAPENRREMALVWGDINHKYAEEFYKKNQTSENNNLHSSFDKRFSRPYISLIKQIINFIKR